MDACGGGRGHHWGRPPSVISGTVGDPPEPALTFQPPHIKLTAGGQMRRRGVWRLRRGGRGWGGRAALSVFEGM